jgi:hypothetical protein
VQDLGNLGNLENFFDNLKIIGQKQGFRRQKQGTQSQNT